MIKRNKFFFSSFVSLVEMNGETDFLVLSFSFIQCQHNHIHIYSVEGRVIGFHQSLLGLVVIFFLIMFQSNKKERTRERERGKKAETKDI